MDHKEQEEEDERRERAKPKKNDKILTASEMAALNVLNPQRPHTVGTVARPQI